MTDPAADSWSAGRRYAFLALLCLIGLIAFVDRQIITILIEPIKAEFGASDTAMGALTGIIFSGFYAAAAIPLARLSDRRSRRNLIAVCLAFWSAMTSLGGFAVSFLMLAATRVGVAVAEAGAIPASHSLIADLFPVRRRATALGLLSASQAIGIGMGVLLGGLLLSAFDWRTSFLVVGFPGIAIAIIMLFLVREPPRGLSENLAEVDDQPPFKETLAALWSIRSYRYIFLLVGFGGFCGYGLLGWGPTFLIRIHDMPVDQIGLWFGGAVALSLVIGNIAGGWLADRFGERDLRRYLWIAGGGPALAFIPGLVFIFSPNWQVAIAAIFVLQLVLTTHIPTCYMLCQTLARPRMRALSSVIVGLASGVVGAGLSPLIIGMTNDVLTPSMGGEALRYALIAPVCCTLLAFGASLIGARYVREDYAALQKDQ